MRKLSQKRERFLQISSNYSNLYYYSNKQEQLTASSGVLNLIWNQWNNFWRDFWIAHVSGGYDFFNNPIPPIYINYSDKQSCHYLMFACGKRNNHNIGQHLQGTHLEATWGDPNVIANIATTMLSQHNSMNYLLGVLSHYQTQIKHFQKIRNSFIHLNNENIYHLNNLRPYYRFNSDHRLIDILETTEISTSSKCYNYLIDNMTGMLKSL